MSKKEISKPVPEHIVVLRDHHHARIDAESREADPRDSVYEKTNPESGEISLHRVPLRAFRLDDRGHEILDPVPVAPPVSSVPMSTFDQIREYNRRQDLLNNWPDATLADEDNFNIPDEPLDPNTQWEHTFEVASIDEVFRRARQIVSDRKQKTAAKPADGQPPSDGPRPPASGTPAPEPRSGS